MTDRVARAARDLQRRPGRGRSLGDSVCFVKTGQQNYNLQTNLKVSFAEQKQTCFRKEEAGGKREKTGLYSDKIFCMSLSANVKSLVDVIEKANGIDWLDQPLGRLASLFDSRCRFDPRGLGSAVRMLAEQVVGGPYMTNKRLASRSYKTPIANALALAGRVFQSQHIDALVIDSGGTSIEILGLIAKRKANGDDLAK